MFDEIPGFSFSEERQTNKYKSAYILARYIYKISRDLGFSGGRR
jgi:hypothetical protein